MQPRCALLVFSRPLAIRHPSRHYIFLFVKHRKFGRRFTFTPTRIYCRDNPRVLLFESHLASLDKQLCSRPILHVVHEFLFSSEIFVSVLRGVGNWAAISNIGEQIALLIVKAESALRLLLCVMLCETSHT